MMAVRLPSDEEARALRLSSTAEVVHLERVRMHGTEPLTYSMVAIPRRLFAGPISNYDWSIPLHLLLESIGHR